MTGPGFNCPLQDLALRRPAGVFLSTPGGDLTFSEVDQLVQECVRTLHHHTVYFCDSGMDPVEDTLVPMFACFRKGIPIVLQNKRLPASRLKEQRAWVLACMEKANPFAATLLFTSGSSGAPKAVVHSYQNHWSSAQAANRQARLFPGDRWLCSLPLYHVGGLAIVFRCLEAGATVCFPRKEESLSETIESCHPTHVSLVPTQLYRWMNEPGFFSKGVKRILIGGAGLPDFLRREAETRGLPIATSYGMTETASQISATPPGSPVTGSGEPLDHVQVQIAKSGEILVKGRSVAVGHLTEEGILPITDPEGWLHTRDVGRIENGVLYVEGRKDNQFISGGENIQPEMIEAALIQIAGIHEAVVVPKPDEEFGFRPLAWVDAEISESETEVWNRKLREELPGYMIPVEYRRLPDPNGLKRNREELRSYA